jgi:uncharacterized membrane protein
MIQTAVLWLHIAAGGAALAASTVAIVAAKGGTAHRRAGTAFALAMAVVAASAFLLAVARPSPFLFSVAVLSGYLTYAGREAGKGPDRPRRPMRIAAAVMLGVGLAMATVAAMALLGAADARHLAGPVPGALLAFGLIGAAVAVQDLVALGGGARERPQERLARHLARMLGAAIAAWTAFAVVNFKFLPALVAWLGPTLIVVPLIVYWSRRSRRGDAYRGGS